MMIKRIIFVLTVLVSVNAYAQTVAAKYAGEFLAIGVGGRPAGMGGAFTALSNDVTGAYYNPAGLAQINFPQIGLMHDERFGNLVNYNYGAVAIPYGKDYTVALSIMRLGVDGIPDTRNALVDKVTGNVIYDIYNENARIDPSKVKEFNNQDWALYFSVAKQQSEDMSFGVNVKVIRRSIAEFSAFGIGFDAGMLYKASENLALGVSLQDVTTTLVSWSTGRNELITPTLKIGSMYYFKPFESLRLSPALDFDIRFENRKFASSFNVGPVSFDPHLGLEAMYNNVFAIRAGYNDVKQITIGAGIKLPKLNIDYSFARFALSEEDRLPDTHRISVIITLEQPKFAR